MFNKSYKVKESYYYCIIEVFLFNAFSDRIRAKYRQAKRRQRLTDLFASNDLNFVDSPIMHIEGQLFCLSGCACSFILF